MPEFLVCKGCGKKYKFPEALRGKSVRCKACSHRMVVPDQEEEPCGEYDFVTPELPPESYDGAGENNSGSQPASIAPKSSWANAIQNRQTQAPAVSRRKAENESAAAVVDANRGIKALKPFYKNTDAAIDYYMRRRTATFPAQRASPACACCEKSADKIRMFTWTYQRRTGTSLSPSSALTVFGGVVTVRRRYMRYTFNTYHAICPSCWSLCQLRQAAATFGKVFLFAALPVVFVFADWWSVSHKGDNSTGLPIIIFSGIPIVLGLLFINKLKIPGRLRFMSGGKFRLKRATSCG